MNGPPGAMSQFRAALRHVVRRAPQVRPLWGATPLELMSLDGEPPRFEDARPVEDATVCAHQVPGAPTARIAAFLDGVQHSEVVAWEGPAPVVVGCVAASIRVRSARRLAGWGAPIVRRHLYVPFAYASLGPWQEMLSEDLLTDTSASTPGAPALVPHPVLLLERARLAVQRRRERVEHEMAHRWCAAESRPLLVDGSISGSETLATAACAVGVIKSHRTLYVDSSAPGVVLGLAYAQRSSVIRIAPHGRSAVLSWYLRLRPPGARGALWGLVRVEVAETSDVDARADEVSRWLLAERVPLSCPDPRWDALVYGIRNTEEFLRALT